MTRQANRLQDGLIVENGSIGFAQTGTITVNGSQNWVFNESGNLTLPVPGNIIGASGTLNLSDDSNVSITAGSTYGFFIATNGGGNGQPQWGFAYDGSTQFPHYQFPSADGTSGQVLATNGSGQLSWTTPSGGGGGGGGPSWELTSSTAVLSLDADGTLELPYNANLKPYGSTSSQILKIYPTVTEGNHLHLSSGDLTQTSLFLGTDNQYIRTNIDGSMVIGTDDSIPDQANSGYRWTFGADGKLSLPRNNIITAEGNAQVGYHITVTDDFTMLQSVADGSGGDQTLVTWSDGASSFITQIWTPFCVGQPDAMVGWTMTSSDNVVTHVLAANNSGIAYTIEVDAYNIGAYPWTFQSPNYVAASDNTINFKAADKHWTFGTDGTLTFPNPHAQISFSSGTGGEMRFWYNDDITIYRNGQDGYGVKNGEVDVYASNNWITKTTTSGVELKQGVLKFPDATTQSTAWTPSNITQDVTFTGLVTFANTATYSQSTNTVYTDNIIELHAPPGGVNGTWSSDDGKDIGLRFHYYHGADKNAALYMDDGDYRLKWTIDAVETNGQFSHSGWGDIQAGTFYGNLVSTGTVTATNFVGNFIGSVTTATTLSNSGTNFRVVSPPSLLTGTAGDRTGDVAFDASYFYYCTTTYGGIDYVSVTTAGQTATYAYIAKSGQSRNGITANEPQPQAGWTITIPGSGTFTITSVSDAGNIFGTNSWQVNWSGSSVLTTGGTQVTVTNPGIGNTWVRTPWNAITSVNTATTSTVGGVKIGSNLTAVGDGTISFNTSTLVNSAINVVTIGSQSANATYYPTVAGGNNNNAQQLSTVASFQINPSSGLLTVSTVLGNAYGGVSGNTSNAIGYLGMPQNSQAGSYTIALSDQGKHVYATATTSTITIPANTVTSFPIGSTVAIIASPTSTATISIQTDTLYLGGTGSTGNRTLAPYGMATAVKVTNTTWYISGLGLT